ncbi:hypothetical protein Poli38472_001755 [Pythium oligandrum]|uniref:Uncharacterized protein n=1 Tax=Pythium oligandrum TaxID=41045 RepID=A0A8K1FQN1_PYTOL|nr:hypothetical protein Poli38472_001755 [Pythium oligandrum]|eukprot:TMW69599.1 hypothetical protein Poli38472_001755 [Pythium oligandrum]
MTAAAASSQRGRKFAGGRVTNLRESALVQQLHTVQAEVEALARRRDLMESMMLNAKVHAIQYAVQMTKQFYEIFSHGYNPAAHPMQSRQAEVFLRSLMTEDVMCTEFIGVDMFLRQYEIGALYHTSMSVALHDVSHVEHGDLAIHVKASAVARFRISRETLTRFFPSIIQDEQLTQQLIGQEYEMQYDKVFHFQNGRIFQHESRVDFCGGLMRMVGDPFLAMKLLQASIMTKHGHWKINNQIEEDRHELQNSLL